jgi:hypothetical protein
MEKVVVGAGSINTARRFATENSLKVEPAVGAWKDTSPARW